MKMFGRRIPKGNTLLFFSFTAISICFLLIVTATRAEYRNKQSQNSLYSGHAKWFSISNADQENLWEDVIQKLDAQCKDFSISLSVMNPKNVMRGVVVQGKVDSPPMLEGEFFDFSTSWTDTPKVVLGNQLKKNIVIKNEKMIYTYNDVEFEVIGIMGTKEDSRMNHMILIDFKSAVGMSGVNTSYMLDTKKKSAINHVGQKLKDLFRSPAEIDITIGEPQYHEAIIAYYFKSDNILNTMYVAILFSFSLSTVLVTFIWLRSRAQLLFVWLLCGYAKRSERIEIAKRFYLVTGLGFLIGILFMSVISQTITNINMLFVDVLKAFGMTIGLGTVILLFCYFMNLRKITQK